MLLVVILLIQNDAKKLKNDRNPHMSTHLRELSESYPMNTNMTVFRCFFKNLCNFVFSAKVALALEGLTNFSQV